MHFSKWTVSASVFIMATILASCLSLGASEVDVEVATNNWRTLNSSIEFDEVNAKKHLESLYKEEQCCWSDFSLLDERLDVEEAALTSTLIRLNTVSRIAKTKEQKLEIANAIEFLLDLYEGSEELTGNWWHWEIGIPKQINIFLLHNLEWLPEHLKSRLISVSSFYLPKPNLRHASPLAARKPQINSSTSRVNTVLIVLQRSLISKDPKAIDEAMSSLWEVLELSESGDGFYADGGFLLHEDIPYIGTYGSLLFDGLVDIIEIVKGTRWEPPQEVYFRIVERLRTHVVPFIEQGHMLEMVNGRAVSRGWKQSDGYAKDVRQLLTKLKELVPAELKKQVQELLARLNEPVQEITAAYYPSIDRLVYRTPDYSTSLAMHSNRVGNYECINGENLKGWYSSDGMTYLYINPDDYVGIWPLFDEVALPGTTVDGRPQELCRGIRSHGNRKEQMQWVGGTTADQFALAGMDFSNWNGTLTIKKSWFYLPNRIVAIGSDGSGGSITNIAQEFSNPDADSKFKEVLDSKAFYFEDKSENRKLGVYLPYKQVVNNDFIGVCKSWSDVNAQTKWQMKEDTICKNRASLSLSHSGKDYQDYAYILFPNSSPEALKIFDANPDVEVVKRTDVLHAVYSENFNMLLFNSFSRKRDKVFDGIEIEGNVSAALSFYSDGVDINLSSPNRSDTSVRVYFDKEVELAQENKRVKVEGRSVTFNVSGMRGRQINISLLFK